MIHERRVVVDDSAPLRGYAAHEHDRGDDVDEEQDSLQELCDGKDLGDGTGRLARLVGVERRGTLSASIGGLGGVSVVVGVLEVLLVPTRADIAFLQASKASTPSTCVLTWSLVRLWSVTSGCAWAWSRRRFWAPRQRC